MCQENAGNLGQIKTFWLERRFLISSGQVEVWAHSTFVREINSRGFSLFHIIIFENGSVSLLTPIT